MRVIFPRTAGKYKASRRLADCNLKFIEYSSVINDFCTVRNVYRHCCLSQAPVLEKTAPARKNSARMAINFQILAISANEQLSNWHKSMGDNSISKPRLPPEINRVGKVCAWLSITVGRRFFCPNGLMPPTK